MGEHEIVALMLQLIGPLVGAGAGSYFGLKSAINGLRERSERIEHTLNEVRDKTHEIEWHARQRSENS